MPQRRARRAGRLVEVDRPLLDRDERREAGQELRHRRPAQTASPAARASRRGPSARVTPAAAVARAPVVDLASASTAGDTRRVDRGSSRPARPWRQRVGYSRAVATGATSTSPAPRRSCRTTPTRLPTRTNRARAASRSSTPRSREAGASPSDVVRTRVSHRRRRRVAPVGRAHGEVFGDVRPRRHRS